MRNLGPFQNSTTTKVPFVCTFFHTSKGMSPLGLSYVVPCASTYAEKCPLDQSRMVWTSPESRQHVRTCCPDFLIWTAMYLCLDQIWTKSGLNLESGKNRLDQFRQPPSFFGLNYSDQSKFYSACPDMPNKI